MADSEPRRWSKRMRQKERQREETLLRREAARQNQQTTVLVGCEGESELEYLKGFRQAHRIGRIHLVFTACGHDPSRLLKSVEERFVKGKGNFDAVFCVFDRDEHVHFDAVCRRIHEMGGLSFKHRRAPIQGITSNPCFELWLLFHFADVRRELQRDEVYRRLRDHLPDYKKASATIYGLTCGHLEVAIERAGRLPSGKNPSTEVGKLIQELRRLWNLGPKGG